jgi:hypothetical protein
MIPDVDVDSIRMMILSRYRLLYRCSGDALYLSTDLFKRKYGKLLAQKMEAMFLKCLEPTVT